MGWYDRAERRWGTNALYGGHGENVFSSVGNAVYNQIWGGLSKSGGYGNNTLIFNGATTGIYVDLLNGHDAYISCAEGGAWTGSGRFEIPSPTHPTSLAANSVI